MRIYGKSAYIDMHECATTFFISSRFKHERAEKEAANICRLAGCDRLFYVCNGKTVAMFAGGVLIVFPWKITKHRAKPEQSDTEGDLFNVNDV